MDTAPQNAARRTATSSKTSPLWLGLVAALIVTSCSGCRICASGEDGAYAAYGGLWKRMDRYNGRVGSLASQAGDQTYQQSPRPQQPPLEQREPRFDVEPSGGETAQQATLSEDGLALGSIAPPSR